jgi:hypothetical protein
MEEEVKKREIEVTKREVEDRAARERRERKEREEREKREFDVKYLLLFNMQMSRCKNII